MTISVEFGLAQLRHQFRLVSIGQPLDPGLLSHGIRALEEDGSTKYWEALAELRRLYAKAVGAEPEWEVTNRLSRAIAMAETAYWELLSDPCRRGHDWERVGGVNTNFRAYYSGCNAYAKCCRCGARKSL